MAFTSARISVISELEIPMKKGLNFLFFCQSKSIATESYSMAKKLFKKMKFHRSGTLKLHVFRMHACNNDHRNIDR